MAVVAVLVAFQRDTNSEAPADLLRAVVVMMMAMVRWWWK